MKEVSSDKSTKARLSEAGSQPRLADSEAQGVFSTTHASYRLEVSTSQLDVVA